MQALQELAACHGLAQVPSDFLGTLEATELAFIGLGLSAAAKPRLNIYLKRRQERRNYSAAVAGISGTTPMTAH